MPFQVTDAGEVTYSGRTLEEQRAQIALDAEERIRSIRNDIPNKQAKLETAWGVYKLLAALAAGRPTIKLGYWCEESYITVECELDDLEPIARVIGALEEHRKGVADAKKKLVEITRRSHRYPFVYVQYKVKLPKKLDNGEAPKCRIETRRTVEKVLVCEL
jgi:hypothetical protein